jgi:hypothetical protein
MADQKPDSQIDATDFVLSALAGEALAARDAVYINTADGKFYKCDADDPAKVGFVGFVVAAAASGATAYVSHYSHLGGFSGLTINAPYYLSSTAGAVTATKPTHPAIPKIVGWGASATVMRIYRGTTKRRLQFDAAGVNLGDNTTRYDITAIGGGIFRYTWDGTGTNPVINATTFPIGSGISFRTQNFTAANNGEFIVVGSGANYVEVSNPLGVAENDKTVGTGNVRAAQTYTKPASLIRARVQLVGGGSNGSNERDSDSTEVGGSGGDSAGYVMKEYNGVDLPSSVAMRVGFRGEDSAFATTLLAKADRTASGGDLNLYGQSGLRDPYGRGGFGGNTPLGTGGVGTSSNDTNGDNAVGYGSGGGGASVSSTPSGIGGLGAPGVIIIEDEY